jgi:hypothetical protein
MNKITPFLWFNDNAEDAAELYLSVGSSVCGRRTELAKASLQVWTNRRRCSSCKSTMARTARERYCRLDGMKRG